MTSRLTASEIMSGMGAGMRLIQLLETGIRGVGGSTETLALITRPRFAGNVEQIARAIVACDWRIPASEMREKALRNYKREFVADPQMTEEVREFWWTPIMLELGLPFERYGGSDYPPIPFLYKNQLEDREVSYPILFEHGNKPGSKVLVDINTGSDCLPLRQGRIINMNEVEGIAVADSAYFDFSK